MATLYDNSTIITDDGVKLVITGYSSNNSLGIKHCEICGKDGCGKVKLLNTLTEDMVVKNICIRMTSDLYLSNGWNAYIHDVSNDYNISNIVNFKPVDYKYQSRCNKEANRLLERFSKEFKKFPDDMYYKVLEKEGITREMAKKHNLIYVPLMNRAATMKKLGNANEYIGLAGFNTKTGYKEEIYYSFSGMSGVWFPVYDEDFNIVNFNIWADFGIKEKILKLKGVDLAYEVEKICKNCSTLDSKLQKEYEKLWEDKQKGLGKYNPLSSAKKDNGCKPNQLASVYRPMVTELNSGSTMIGTEGARKGIFLSEKTGLLVNAVFGVGNYKHQVKIIKRKLEKAKNKEKDKFGNVHKPITNYISAYDSDKIFNSMVLNAELRKLKEIKALGVNNISTMLWCPYTNKEDTKGIDDIYNKGYQDTIQVLDVTKNIDSFNASKIVFSNISLVLKLLMEFKKEYKIKIDNLNKYFYVYKELSFGMRFIATYCFDNLAISKYCLLSSDGQKIEDIFHLSKYKESFEKDIHEIISKLKISEKNTYLLEI